MSTHELTFSVPLLSSEEEVEITVEFEITSWGSPQSWDDPGSGPEWDINRIWLDEEEVTYSPNQIEHALWHVLADAAYVYIDNNFDFAAHEDYDIGWED